MYTAVAPQHIHISSCERDALAATVNFVLVCKQKQQTNINILALVLLLLRIKERLCVDSLDLLHQKFHQYT